MPRMRSAASARSSVASTEIPARTIFLRRSLAIPLGEELEDGALRPAFELQLIEVVVVGPPHAVAGPDLGLEPHSRPVRLSKLDARERLRAADQEVSGLAGRQAQPIPFRA